MATFSLRHSIMAALVMAFSLFFAFPPSASAESRDGYTAFAQAQVVRGPTRLTAPGKGKRVDCNGKSASDCCKGLSYCGCLYSPMGGESPLACFAGTKPKN